MSSPRWSHRAPRGPRRGGGRRSAATSARRTGRTASAGVGPRVAGREGRTPSAPAGLTPIVRKRCKARSGAGGVRSMGPLGHAGSGADRAAVRLGARVRWRWFPDAPWPARGVDVRGRPGGSRARGPRRQRHRPAAGQRAGRRRRARPPVPRLAGDAGPGLHRPRQGDRGGARRPGDRDRHDRRDDADRAGADAGGDAGGRRGHRPDRRRRERLPPRHPLPRPGTGCTRRPSRRCATGS